MSSPLDSELQVQIKRLFSKMEERAVKLRIDLQERENRGAMVIQVIEPVDSDKLIEPGDIMEVTSPEGKPYDAEVIEAHRVLAFNPEYGPTPCWEITVEVLNPDRMTKEDFESLYGEEEKDEEEEADKVPEAPDLSGKEIPHEQVLDVPGNICDCGAESLDCQLNQKYFGVHLNE